MISPRCDEGAGAPATGAGQGPVILGGAEWQSHRSRRWAARSDDGWVSANSDYESLAGMIGQLNQLRQEYGRFDRDDFEIHAFATPARTLDDSKRLAGLGVTGICVTPWNPDDSSLNRERKLAKI